MNSLEPGQTILHYRIVGKIGQGGMGEVYQAEDLKLERRVALKRLPAETRQDEKTRQRFLREARSASALNHPNIVTIYAIEEADGFDFIAMEYVEGQSFRENISRGPLDLPQLINLGSQIAEALYAAHSIGLIHRDIKSANILLTPRGQAKVLDFGLAKMIQPISGELNTAAATLVEDLTGAGVVLGTIAYMSPEQSRGEALDARSDIFSLGVVLYEAATGDVPFSGPSILSTLHDIATVDPPPPSAVRPDLPPEFDAIINRALAKDKEQRYSSAGELADELRRLGGSITVSLSGFLTGETPKPKVADEAFVGRDFEMQRLEQSLRQALAGSGCVVFITGEPGIGKTALADEFLRRARRIPSSLIVGRGRCVEQYGPGEAYLPFLDALGALLAGPGRERVVTALRTFAPTWCLQFPAVFASSGALEQLQRETIGVTKERMLREIGDALGALAKISPTVLLLEDLHWADTSSADLLRHLSQRIGHQRLLIVGTFRPEDLELSQHPLKNYKLEMQAHRLCEEIALGALGEEYIASYLDARFSPNDFPRELSVLIKRKTEGHPLFATSLVHFLAEHGDIAKTNGHWTLTRALSEMDLEAPENVRSMIRKTIEALSEEDRRTLQYASIEGEEFISTVLARLLSMDELDLEERLDRLARVHRLVEAREEEELPDGALATRYRFSHALYQNSFYGDLVSKRRILLHRQAGEQLVQHYGAQSSRIAAQLAVHFERGRDFSRAVQYLIQAADNATHIYANAEAAEHYTHALGLVEKLRAEEQAEQYLTIYQKRGAVNLAVSRFDQAVDDFGHMLNQARASGVPALEAGALNGMMSAMFYAHRTQEMSALVDEALRAAAAAGSETLRVETMLLVAMKHQCYGELSEAKPLLDEVILTARSINHRPALLGGLAWRGNLHFFQTEYERAEETEKEALGLASELRDGFLLLFCLFNLGLIRGNLGRMSEALQTLNEAVEMARRNGDRFWVSRLPNCIGWIYRELQDFERALEYDQRGVEIAQEDRVLEAESNSLINIGIDHLHIGRDENTLPAFREVEAIFQRDAWFRWRYNIRLQAASAEYWLAQGNLDQAEEYTRRLLDTATVNEVRKYIAVAYKLRADIAVVRGDLAAAEAELTASLDWVHRYPAPVVAWKTYAALGRLRLRAGDRTAAREAFVQSAAIVNQIAANVNDEQLRATFLKSPAVREVLEGSSSVGQLSPG